MGRFTLN